MSDREAPFRPRFPFGVHFRVRPAIHGSWAPGVTFSSVLTRVSLGAPQPHQRRVPRGFAHRDRTFQKRWVIFVCFGMISDLQYFVIDPRPLRNRGVPTVAHFLVSFSRFPDTRVPNGTLAAATTRDLTEVCTSGADFPPNFLDFGVNLPTPTFHRCF